MTGAPGSMEPVPTLQEELSKVEYDTLRGGVMDQARTIRGLMADTGHASLLIPYSEAVEGAVAGFDEVFAQPYGNYGVNPTDIVSRGFELRLMGSDDQWGIPRLKTDISLLEHRPLGIYYTYRDVDGEQLGGNSFRFGILPEKDRIETASSFFLWDSEYHKAAVDTEDLAYMRLLLTDAKAGQHRPAADVDVSFGGLRRLIHRLF